MPPANHLIIHVVSQLKPARCGVSDYALAVAGQLEDEFSIKSAFAVINSNVQIDVPYPRVYCAQSELLQACNSLSLGEPATLLVHLSGYGFSRDGAPSQLAEELSSVRRTGQYQIAVYFHELYATGMPWKSAFWYSRRQKRAVRRIAGECDWLFTNSERHARWLESETVRLSRYPIQVLPVPSNAGESRVPVPFRIRRPALIVFGLASSRRIAYLRLSSLGKMFSKLGIQEVLDIGPPFDAPAELNGISVKRLGVLSATELADQLSRAKFGFVKHSASTLAKSGIFAAYCAHGTVSIVPDEFSGQVDGLEDGVHVISPQTVDGAGVAGLDRCSIEAWMWYSHHRLSFHAGAYARLLAGVDITAAASIGALGSMEETQVENGIN